MRSDPGVPVLALNAGSSSLKFGMYLVDAGGSRVLVSGAGPLDEPHRAIERIAGALSAQGMPAPVAIGHRIVQSQCELRAAEQKIQSNPICPKSNYHLIISLSNVISYLYI